MGWFVATLSVVPWGNDETIAMDPDIWLLILFFFLTMRTKARKYADLANHHRLIQPGDSRLTSIAGQWRSSFSLPVDRVVLELACGRGEYSQTMSGLDPSTGRIGVDIRAERMWHGIRFADEQNRTNMLFLRTIIHHLDRYFVPWEVDEIWIVHPDPRPRGADERRRLTSFRFIPLYERLLTPWGIVRLKTDHQWLFAYSLGSFAAHGWSCGAHTDDLYTSPLLADHHGVQTQYEKKARASWSSICYAWRKKPC